MLTPEQIALVQQANSGLRFFFRESEYRDDLEYRGWVDVYEEVYPTIILESRGTFPSIDPSKGHCIVNDQGKKVRGNKFFVPVFVGVEDLDQDASTPE